MRHPDGSVHSASVPVRYQTAAPGTLYGPQKAVVLATYLLGDSRNRFGVAVECDVILYRDRRIIRGVPVEQRGGYDSSAGWIPQPTTRDLDTGAALVYERTQSAPQWLESSQLKDLDGDHVVVDFFGGDVNDPIIRGMRPHPRSSERQVANMRAALVAFLRLGSGKEAQIQVGDVVRVLIGADVDVHGVNVTVTADTQAAVKIGATTRILVNANVSLTGDEVWLNGNEDSKGVARLDDEVQVDPNDAALNTAWASWVDKVTTVVQNADPTCVKPTTAIKGAVTAASATVKAGD